MGMYIRLLDELGQDAETAVADDRNVLPRILAAANANDFALLQHLDLYGDTIFNRSQLDVLSEEWSRLMPHAQGEEEQSLLRAVAGLIARGRSDVHQYLKFVGD